MFLAEKSFALQYVVNDASVANYLGVFDKDDLQTLAGTSPLYKTDENGPSKIFSDTATQFKNGVMSEPLNAIISLKPGELKPELTYLALKAGDNFAVWDISSWNEPVGYTELLVSNDVFFNGNNKPRAISHVAIYGTESTFKPQGGTQDVPDGSSTLALLGISLIALRFSLHPAKARPNSQL